MSTKRISNGRRSQLAFNNAKKSIPGGVNSPVRAWSRLGGQPPVIAKGEGAWIEDVDGRRYVDYVLSWGPLILGHAHPKVINAVTDAVANGLSFGAPTIGETELAELVCSAFTGMQQVRLVNSGTEATMSALRLARAATGRDLIIKCDGCYHGHADYLLVAAGSGAATFGQPDSAGVPAASAEQTLVVPYNDLPAVERLLKKYRKKVAAVIIEPVAGNMGLIEPDPGYLAGLRAATKAAGALLVFDEVMTGFRTAWGGYQNICKVKPDLTCLGKVIGGGMPVGAYGGPRSLMKHLAPNGPCYQAGTLSGNPVAVAAGLATLRFARRGGFYELLGRKAEGLLKKITALADKHGVPLQVTNVGSMMGWFFHDRPVRNFQDAAAANMDQWKVATKTLLAEGVHPAPSPFEAAFISSAHGAAELKHTVAAWDKALEAAAAV